ncbi:MAG: metal ABC transporter substrate-binding protein [Prochlorococcus sp.]
MVSAFRIRGIRASVFCPLASLVTVSALQAPVQANQLTVVAVDGVLCDLTRTLVEADVNVVCLIQPGGDPHNYRLRPSDREALSKAALVLNNGFNLTPAAKKMRGTGQVVAVAELAMPDYNGSDPHVWHDPANSAAMVAVIAERLAPVIPASQRSALASRAANASTILDAVGVWGGKQFANLPKQQRVLASEHQAYSHLAKRYGVRQITMLDSFTTGGTLRPSSLRKITTEVKGSGARTLFPESLPSNKTLRRISRSTGLPINATPLFADGLAPGRSSVSTATLNICTVVNGQGGQCDQKGADELVKRWAAIR